MELPSSLTEPSVVRTVLLVVTWMVVSISLILFNKWLLSYAGYHYPIAMVSGHLSFLALISRAACDVFRLATPPELSWQQYWTLVLPLGASNALSICLCNVASMLLSVPMVQMLKAAITPCSFLLGIIMGLESFSMTLFGCVLAISLGVSTASFVAVDFNVPGMIAGIFSMVLTAYSLVATQRIMQAQDIRFDAITGNYYSAPVSAAFLLAPAWLLEREALSITREMPLIMLSNACLAAALNISTFAVVGRTSAVTYGVLGQIKDWLNILAALVVFNDRLTLLQVSGYSMAVAGVFAYRHARSGVRSYTGFCEASHGDCDGLEELVLVPSEPALDKVG